MLSPRCFRGRFEKSHILPGPFRTELEKQVRALEAGSEDWEVATGRKFERDDRLALQAMRYDTIVHRREAAELARALKKPPSVPGRDDPDWVAFVPCGIWPTDRSKEPWGVRCGDQLQREAEWEVENDGDFPVERWYLRTVTKTFRSDGASFVDTMTALAFFGKGWGRVTRANRFKDGKMAAR